MDDLLRLPSDFDMRITVREGESEDSDEELKLKEPDLSENYAEQKDLGDQQTQDFQLNVLIKLNVNPSEAMTFKQETKNKRVVVVDTKKGMEKLKGLPILFVDDRDVSNWTIPMLEDMWKTLTLPSLLQFGAEPLDLERVIATSTFHSSEDHISFLGDTVSMAYDDEELKKESTYEDELDVLPEENLGLGQIIDLKPISYNGTQGDQSNWAKQCKQRAQIITELLNTEKSYIKGLEELNEEFLKPFAEPLKKATNVDISSFQIKIEILIDLHERIYSQFCSAKNICIVFQQEFKFLKMYKPYIKDYEDTLRSLMKVKKKSRFKGIFKKSKTVSSNPLGYFQARGITMVQRPPRYILLLQQLQKRTPLEHPMYRDLEKGLEEMKGTCGDINEYQRQLENETKLFELSQEIDLRSLKEHGIPTLVIPARKLIRVGEAAIKKLRPTSMFNRSPRGGSENMNFELGGVVMCNDILIIIHGKRNRVRRVFKVAEMEVEVHTVPIKPRNKNQKFEKIFEVELRKRSAEEIEKMKQVRHMERMSLFITGKSDSGKSVVSLAQSSLEQRDEEDFSIYLSTLEEAMQWERSIIKYSNSEYVN